MADAKDLARARRFVRENKDHYLEQGLRKKLLEAGHDHQVVETVLAETGQPPSAGSIQRSVVVLVIVVLAINGLFLWQACSIIPWIVVAELIGLGNLVRMGRRRTTGAEQTMQRVMTRGCLVGFLLSLPLIAIWMASGSCSPFQSQPSTEPSRPAAASGGTRTGN